MNKSLKNFVVAALLLLIGTYSCELDTIDACPCITSVVQPTARLGEDITLNGNFTNLDPTVDIVNIGGNEAEYSIVGSQIIAKVPSGFVSNQVEVMIDAQSCGNVIENCKGSFDYKTVTVSGIDPSMAKRGEDITISGSNFNTQDLSQNKVRFGSVPATNIKSVDENKLVVEVPTGAETGDITVNVDGFEVNAGQFTYMFSVETVEVLGTTCEIPNFDFPTGIATDSKGDIYVVDRGACQIFKISAETVTKEPYAGTLCSIDDEDDNNNGQGAVGLTSARFNKPFDVTVDIDDQFYITDTGNGQIRKIASELVTIHVEGQDFPFGITVDDAKNIFFSDQTFTIKQIPTGTKSRRDYGEPIFNGPIGLTIDGEGDLYVADTKNHKIRFIDAENNDEVIDFAGQENPDDVIGSVSIAAFDNPRDVEIDSKNNVFIADSANNKIKVITSTGWVYTLHGGENTCIDGYSDPHSLALFESTDQKILYIADTGKGVIKKLVYK